MYLFKKGRQNIKFLYYTTGSPLTSPISYTSLSDNSTCDSVLCSGIIIV